MNRKVLRTTKQATRDILKYNSARQKRCWAVVVEALQQFIPGNEEIDWKNSTPNELRNIIPFSKNDTFVVPVNPKYVVSRGRSVKPTLLKMQKVNVIEEVDEDGVKHSYPLFYDIMENNGEYSIGLPFLSLRWLLDFTKKMGYVSFCVESFINLQRPTSMNLYLYISENLKREHPRFGRGVWEVNIDELRERLGCPEQIDTNRFITDYIRECGEEMETKGCRLTFEFEYILKQITRGKRARIVGLRFRVTDHGWPRKTGEDMSAYDRDDEPEERPLDENGRPVHRDEDVIYGGMTYGYLKTVDILTATTEEMKGLVMAGLA